MPCCDNIKHLGCFGYCSDIDTGLLADADGIHYIEYEVLGKKFQYEVTLTIGQEFVVKNFGNENSMFHFRILKPDESYFTTAEGESCFSIKNVVDLGVVGDDLLPVPPA